VFHFYSFFLNFPLGRNSLNFLTLIIYFDKGDNIKNINTAQQKEVEAVCNPIITKLYQGAGGMPGGTKFISGTFINPSNYTNGFFRPLTENLRINFYNLRLKYKTYLAFLI